MRGLWAVYKREVALYFRSFIAYAIAFALLGIIGLLFAGSIYQQMLGSVMYGQPPSIQLMPLVGQNLAIIAFLMFLVAPLITMRLLAEENREGTLEVLMTMPMGDWSFVLGKFFAAWTLYTVLLALTLVHTIMLATLGALNIGQLVSMYVGTWLYGGATIAIALIWSAITEDQLVAAFLGAAAILTLVLADALAVLVGGQQTQLAGGVSEFVRQIGLNAHHNNLMDGLIQAEDITYFVLVMIVALFITTLIVGTRRWRAA